MRRLLKPEFLVAAGIMALGCLAFYETTQIPVSPMYAKVGPTVMAYGASGLLLGLGILLGANALLGRWTAPPDDSGHAFEYTSFAWLLLGLVLNVGLIGPLGFVPASTLLFICTARAFGSQRPVRDAAIGFMFAAIAYFGFARLLGINIGAGLLEGWI